jgi:hypothetical protein
MLGAGGPATPSFQAACDVPHAGVLAAIPALLANGLFTHVEEHFEAPRGYYPLTQLFLMLAFMILTRIKSVEQLRYQPCGEWGRLLGLDRIPEVRTLREKIEGLAMSQNVTAWSQAMGQHWMDLDPTLTGLLYVDGHVRAYHGEQTCLPERFSSRDRLCVRSLMDYWVNDRDGHPFFVVTALGTEGMIHHLRTQIVPRLIKEVPAQPSEEQLQADQSLHRFVIVFDREGWSPEFFAMLWLEHRIAVLTYRKGRYEPWETDCFSSHAVELPHAQCVEMNLAEKSCALLGGQVAAREIRRLSTDHSHQTAIITTCQRESSEALAGHMFARWSQENFFRYASEELAIDRLGGYGLTPPAPETSVINPLWRVHRHKAQRLRAQRAALQAQRGRIAVKESAGGDVAAFLLQISQIEEKLQAAELELKQENACLRTLPRRVPIGSLPEAQRPQLIAPSRHQLLNTLKILAYRSETALVTLLREKLGRSDDARALAKDLLCHQADLLPDLAQGILLVRLHHFTNPQSSRAVGHLIDHLNKTATRYPGTNLILKYQLVSQAIPSTQNA